MIYDQLCRERYWIDHRTVLPLGQVRTTTRGPKASAPTVEISIESVEEA